MRRLYRPTSALRSGGRATTAIGNCMDQPATSTHSLAEWIAAITALCSFIASAGWATWYAVTWYIRDRAEFRMLVEQYAEKLEELDAIRLVQTDERLRSDLRGVTAAMRAQINEMKSRLNRQEQRIDRLQERQRP